MDAPVFHKGGKRLWVGVASLSAMLLFAWSRPATDLGSGLSAGTEPPSLLDLSAYKDRPLVSFSQLEGTWQGLEQKIVTELLIEAMILVESGGNPASIGRAGERGLLQLKSDSWEMATRKVFGRPVSFERAFEPELNRAVAKAFLGIIQEELHLGHSFWKADERTLILGAYNAGTARTVESGYDISGLPETTRQYISLVEALHDQLVEDCFREIRKMQDANQQVDSGFSAGFLPARI